MNPANGSGSQYNQTRRFLVRVGLVWLLLIGAEFIHGMMRQRFLAPLLGDFPARQLSVATGSLLILTLAFLTIRWIRPRSTRQLLSTGGLWVLLTVAFEMSLGRWLGLSWERILEDYNLLRGGVLGLGLLVMFSSPWLADRLRNFGFGSKPVGDLSTDEVPRSR